MDVKNIKRDQGKDKIKMIALDLDGTTMYDDNHMTDDVACTLNKANDMGIEIVIATGRALHSLPKALDKLKGLRHVVTSNGAAVYTYPERKLYLTNFLEPHSVIAIVDLIKKEGYFAEAFVDGHAYIDQVEYDRVVNGEITYRSKDYVMRTRQGIPHLLDFMIENKAKMENVNINFPSLPMRDEVRGKLEQIPDVTVTSAFPYNFELGGKTTSKAQAISQLLEARGLTSENLITAGDSLNDQAMIRLAGIGIAMGNAGNDTKEVADFIAPTNKEDGLAKALEYILDI